MSLLDQKDHLSSPAANILETELYMHAFGPKLQRKKPRIAASSLEELALAADHDTTTFQEQQELNSTLGLMADSILDKDDFTQEAKEAIFNKGQSKRIWNELYKVIDSSDVVIHVLDARDPLGTRCETVEKYIRDECSHKHLIFVLNKCDLVPTWVAVRFPPLFPFLLTSRLCGDNLLLISLLSFAPKIFVRVVLRLLMLATSQDCLLRLWKIDAVCPWT